MRDIGIAKKILEDENQKIAVVKDGGVVFKSTDRGIKPMYHLAKNMRDKTDGASIADRVIGKGAAILSVYLNVRDIYAELISESAIEILEKNHINYEFKDRCDHIKNRDKTDYCPIEKRSIDTEDPEILLERIEEFLNSLEK